MSTSIAWADVEVGTELPPLSVPVLRSTLVQYAGASGDFNPIHWNQDFAREVGLPDVIAHGMFTMAEACRVVTDWIGDSGQLCEYSVRFTRPVAVPDDLVGTVLSVSGTVAEKLDDNRVKVDLTATCKGETVLGRAYAIVRLP